MDGEDGLGQFLLDAARGLFILALFVVCVVIGGLARSAWLWGW